MFDRLHDIWAAAGRRFHEAAAGRERRTLALERHEDWRQVEEGDRLATRLRRKGMGKAMAETLVRDAAAKPQIGNVLLERIIDDSELLDVSFLTVGARLSQGVARVQIRSPSGRVLGHGTGFLVSSQLLMTNNHVLADRSEAANSVAQFDFYDRPSGTPIVIDEFRFEPHRFFQTNRALDFTLVAVAPQSAAGRMLADRPWNPLIRESGKILVGEPVNIIQHPRGETMKVAFRQNKIVDRLENFLHYATDTERGSSGSQVCNDLWEVAALHHSSVPATNDLGQILLTDGSVWDRSRATIDRIRWVANEGVRISRIVRFLDGLRLEAAEDALYRACFEPSPVLGNEWTSAGRTAEDQGGGLRRTEPDGSVSWYFRVNFGPADQFAQSAAAAAQPGPAGITAPPVYPTTDPAMLAAKDVIERSRPDVPYLDEAANRANIEAYYAGIDLTAGPDQLFDALHPLVEQTHTTRLSYKTARLRHLYPWVDLRENGTLRNVYSGLVLDPAEVVARELERFELARPGFLAEFNPAALDDETADDEEIAALELSLEASQPFNCEHVVPQSWFDERQPMRADLHHLFTCEPDCNSFRSNIPYFDFDPLLTVSPEIDLEIMREDCGQRVGDKFEPELGHGAVARATLYFLLRYPEEVGDEMRELQQERLEVLLSWHETQKPNRYERHRNAAIFAAQGNRNPLIDFPNLARKISFERGFG